MEITYNNVMFEWVTNKEKLNIKKHGMDFRTAVRIFSDDNRIELYDRNHSIEEDRYLTIGMIDNKAFVATVCYTERTDKLRIISAREATKEERRMYNDR